MTRQEYLHATNTESSAEAPYSQSGVDTDATSQEQDVLWSKGTALHESGKCRPCSFVHSRLPCLSGKDCEFCHERHTRTQRPRPSKCKRHRIRKMFAVRFEQE